MKLRKGDKVIVLSGRDKGKTGQIIKVLPKLNKVVVEAVNMLKKNQKPTNKQPRGGISSVSHPIWASKVGIVNPTKAGTSTRIGYKLSADGQKARVMRQAGNQEIK